MDFHFFQYFCQYNRKNKVDVELIIDIDMFSITNMQKRLVWLTTAEFFKQKKIVTMNDIKSRK
jgi:hypothetical protein